MKPKQKATSDKRKQPDHQCADDTAHFVKTLEDNKQVSHEPGPLKPGETHQETTDKDGEKRVERKRFSAF